MAPFKTVQNPLEILGNHTNIQLFQNLFSREMALSVIDKLFTMVKQGCKILD